MTRQASLFLQEKSAYPKVEPRCRYFGTCGGCALQDLGYEDQLALKRDRLRRLLSPLGDFSAVDIVGLEDPWRYRNKAELTFSEVDGQLVLGYHASRSFWRVIDLEDCLLMPQSAMQLARDVRALAAETGLPAYHPKTHKGFFRYLLVRHSRSTGQLLLCLMTTPGHREVVERIAAELRRRHAQLVSVYWGVTSRVADIAIPEELTLLAGAEDFEDRLGPFQLRLHPLSFLQPTAVQAERMYEKLAQSLLKVSARGTAWDLYCGLGVIALYLARHFEKVYAIDVESHHMERARVNAALNGIDRIEFRAGQVEVLLKDRRFWCQEAKPDVVVVDPPRVGLHADALASIIAARPSHVAYFSCNPQSLARDLALLGTGFPRYRPIEAQAFDMFPQTAHLETFVFLARQ